MKKIFAVLFLFFALRLSAQTDSVGQTQLNHSTQISVADDSAKHHVDSSAANTQTSLYRTFSAHYIESSVRKKETRREELSFYVPDWFYNQGVKQNADLISIHTESNAGDIFFYCLLVIIFIVGLVRLLFPKYFHQIFQFVLQPRIRKRNFKESNNSENIIPSVLLNFLFIITSSLCIAQFTQRSFSIDSDWKFWLYAAIIISLIYLVKFIVIKITGWVFNASNAASTYNYVVFTINKILGVMLIPLIVFAAYGSPELVSFVYSASGVIIVLLFAYRYVASFILIRVNMRISVFHFFMYLCAIEILPLLILYKGLTIKFGNIIA